MHGASAGGLVVGALLNRCPALFAAAVAKAPPPPYVEQLRAFDSGHASGPGYHHAQGPAPQLA